jgi:lysozyme family protein
MGAKKLKIKTQKSGPMLVAKSVFDQALDYTFANEGGFSNDKFDHGGATKFGITIGELGRWRKTRASVQDVMNMGAQEAKDIYRAWYWNPLSLDQFRHAGEAMAMFDIGVVMGIGIPPKFAQNICNNHGAHLNIDGDIGPLTIAAVNDVSEPVFIRDFSSFSESRFRSIAAHNPTQNKFLKGWLNRAHRLLTLMNVPDVDQAYKIAQRSIMIGGPRLIRVSNLMDVA